MISHCALQISHFEVGIDWPMAQDAERNAGRQLMYHLASPSLAHWAALSLVVRDRGQGAFRQLPACPVEYEVHSTGVVRGPLRIKHGAGGIVVIRYELFVIREICLCQLFYSSLRFLRLLRF